MFRQERGLSDLQLVDGVWGWGWQGTVWVLFGGLWRVWLPRIGVCCGLSMRAMRDKVQRQDSDLGGLGMTWIPHPFDGQDMRPKDEHASDISINTISRKSEFKHFLKSNFSHKDDHLEPRI